MSVKQVNFRKPTKKSCVKEFEFPLLRIPQNVKTENYADYERLVFEQAKDPVI